jgi:hypothetical protein
MSIHQPADQQKPSVRRFATATFISWSASVVIVGLAVTCWWDWPRGDASSPMAAGIMMWMLSAIIPGIALLSCSLCFFASGRPRDYARPVFCGAVSLAALWAYGYSLYGGP